MTWSTSLVFTSSCLVLPPWPPGAPSSTGPSRCPSSPSKCSTLRTWWPLATQDTADISQLLLFSVAACPWWKLMSKCWTFRIRTHLLNGFLTMSRLLFATFLQGGWRWPPPSLATPQPSRSCSRGSPSNSPPCSGERLFLIGWGMRELRDERMLTGKLDPKHRNWIYKICYYLHNFKKIHFFCGKGGRNVQNLKIIILVCIVSYGIAVLSCVGCVCQQILCCLVFCTKRRRYVWKKTVPSCWSMVP